MTNKFNISVVTCESITGDERSYSLVNLLSPTINTAKIDKFYIVVSVSTNFIDDFDEIQVRIQENDNNPVSFDFSLKALTDVQFNNVSGILPINVYDIEAGVMDIDITLRGETLYQYSITMF